MTHEGDSSSIIRWQCIGTLLLFLGLAMAQPRPVPAFDAGANLPAQKIGPNDLIAVSVYGAPELTRTVRISAEGVFRLPMLERKIDALGRMPADLEREITRALSEEKILVDPVVSVTIVEYASRPILVTGAVRRPLTFQAHGRVTLLEALSRAEGLSPEAGSEIVIRQGSEVRLIPSKALLDGRDPSLNLLLEGGEEIRIPEVGRVFIVGNVRKPGVLRLDDPYGITVLKALAMSEGLAPFATKEAWLYRRSSGGERMEIRVPLRQILDRKSTDLELLTDDIFYVPDNRRGRATVQAIEKVIGFGAATASGALILSVNR